jgi:hypothetical protein
VGVHFCLCRIQVNWSIMMVAKSLSCNLACLLLAKAQKRLSRFCRATGWPVCLAAADCWLCSPVAELGPDYAKSAKRCRCKRRHLLLVWGCSILITEPRQHICTPIKVLRGCYIPNVELMASFPLAQIKPPSQCDKCPFFGYVCSCWVSVTTVALYL